MTKTNEKKRTRTTTSVSTLVNQISDLRRVAKLAGRKDLLKELNEVAEKITILVTDYNEVRGEVDKWIKLFSVEDEDDSSDSKNEESQDEEVEENEEVVESTN